MLIIASKYKSQFGDLTGGLSGLSLFYVSSSISKSQDCCTLGAPRNVAQCFQMYHGKRKLFCTFSPILLYPSVKQACDSFLSKELFKPTGQISGLCQSSVSKSKKGSKQQVTAH